MNVSFSITDLQKKIVPVKPVNVFKKPASLKGAPVFEVDVQGVISIFPADDGASFEVDALKTGTAVVKVTAQSLGGVTLTATVTVTITADPRAAEATDIIFDTTLPPVDEV